MFIAKVIGQTWSSVKNKKLDGLRLMLVKPYFWYIPPHDTDLFVAVDMIDSGPGDDVIICMGAPCRWQLNDPNLCIEASIIGYIDSLKVKKESLEDSNLPFSFIDNEKPKNLEIF